MIRPTPSSTLFPYTTLFRSLCNPRPMAALIVMKFGGTSVADAGRIKRAAQRIVDKRDAGQRVVAVLSARGSTTDELIRSEEHTSELQSQFHLVCRLLLEKKK